MKRTLMVCLVLVLALTGVFAQGAAEADATKWANRVEVYVPARAGGGTDVMARALSTKVSKDAGRNLTIMNNTDGGGVVAYETVRTAKTDGSKLMQFHSTMMIKIASGLYDKSVTEDFTFIGAAVNPGPGGWVLVVPTDAPYNTVDEFIAASKRKQMLMGVETGGTMHLLTGMLALESGANFRYVEAGSDTEKLTTLVGGNIDGCLVNANQAKQYLDAGMAKGIAVVTGGADGARVAMVPEIPSLVELGYDVYFATISFILGPKGMDEGLAREIHRYYSDAADSDEVHAILTPAGMNLKFYPFEEGAAIAARQQEMLNAVVLELGLRE